MATKIAERDRCVTGVEGLDTILYGGIPRSNTVLLTGSCGTGKTSLALEFLMHGAVKGENSLFVSVTENSEKLLQNIIPYKFFDKSLIKSGRLVFVDMPVMYERLGLTKAELSMEEIELLVNSLASLAKELQAKRLVMDSITSVCYKLKTSEKIRDFILKLSKALSDLGCTSILVGEVTADSTSYSTFGVEEAIADGIILMANMERRGDLLRTLQVIKMRGTMHSRAKYVLDLTPVGVLLVPLLKGGSTG
ncbi:MAG: circadian clock protein KaiC [Euryarchaeota archaeon RBG_13_57_23]|nr:MAG: circadian clock protein KaiC [Candidatus Bathyarchaeota archaeon RBG_16_57_9]OGS45052.1 MAG: circadian clock protein KaiC [Euryarchaeota archaeon RBG_13_57_23]